MSHPDIEHLTDIFKDFLAGNTPGLDVELGEAPENPTYPYLVITPFAGEHSGSLARPNEIFEAEWQVNSVGLYPQQAMGGLSAARDRVLGATPDFSAASYVATGSPLIEPAGPAFLRDATEQPPLFSSSETYRLFIVPA